jgi:hypothetical protein
MHSYNMLSFAPVTSEFGDDAQPCVAFHVSMQIEQRISLITPQYQPRHLHPISPLISRPLSAHISAPPVCKWSTDADLHEAVLRPANVLH